MKSKTNNLKYSSSSINKGNYIEKDSQRENKILSNFNINSNAFIKNKYLKKLKENKENMPFNKDKLYLEIHKSLKLISKKASYHNSKKYHNNSDKSVDENKTEQKLNKTLNKIKSNSNNVVNKEKNPNNTLDNFKKSEKIKKFLHNNKNIKSKDKDNEDCIESIEIKKDRKDNIIKRIKNVQIKFNEQKYKEKENIEEDEPKKYFDVSKINNIQIPKEYLNIIYYNLLLEQEKELQPKADPDYMKKQNEINTQMRSILIDWIIDVHFKFGFTDETLFMTILIIDRYLSVNQISRAKLQLLGITALMIACKHEEIDVPKIDDFTYITDNAYVKDEVLKMENDVLSVLNFSLLYPSPIKFFEYLSLHFNFDKKKHMMGKYLMESFLLDIKVNKYKPATISCSCTYIVMKFFKMENYQESYSKKFFLSDEKKEISTEYNVKECAKDICLFVDNINKTNYLACQKKYSAPEQEKVSVIILNH